MEAANSLNRVAIPRKKTFVARFRRDFSKYVIILPAVVLVLMFNYLPIYGVLIAFKDFKPFIGLWGSEWVGFKYFGLFLRDPVFWRVIRNTLSINLANLVFGFPFPIIFALVLNELRAKRLVKITQTISYLPYFISWVVVAAIFVSILSPSTGLINKFLALFGVEPVYFLSKASYFQPILVISSIWKGFGLSAVYYIAALSGIDQELYQAASVDGAGRLRQTWHITLPGLRNIIIVLLVLQIGSIMSIGFEQIFLMYNPMVYDTGDVISTYTYRIGLVNKQFSLSSAIGFMQSVVNFILVFSANWLSRRIAGWSLW
jgi:putative aldouronate transport system permease protein